VAARRGKNRAILAVAHSILVAVYHMLARNEGYQELGGDYFERLNPAGLRRYLVKRLERLGHHVTLEPSATSA
jgi:transposase